MTLPGVANPAPLRDAPRAMNLQTPRILWGALVSSNALYFGLLLYLNTADARRAGLHPDPTLALVFAPVALGLAVASVLLPARLHAAAARAAAVETRDDLRDDPLGATQGFRRPASSERVFADPAAARRAALQAFLAPFIVGMAMAESVSLFGLVLGFLGFGLAVVAPFFVVGAGLQATRYPTEAAVEGPFERAHGARLRA